MALDIAAGRRLPIFFDGQRYMGALEAYTAAAFVRAFGHSPAIVAFAPLLFFGLFAAGQFALWRSWQNRGTGHLAALFAVVGSPMLVVWEVVPRGGYVELLAWAVAAIWLYRTVARRGASRLSLWKQLGVGFALAFGYFLNPLSLVVYAAIALDWMFGRHGQELRAKRLPRASWLDRPGAPLIVLAIACAWVCWLAACCHADPSSADDGSIYTYLLGVTTAGWAAPVGVAGVLSALVVFGWWTGIVTRILQGLSSNPAILLGIVFGISPMMLYVGLARLGVIPLDPGLPVWIGAPWKAGPNLRDGWHALGPLLGCDPRAIGTVLCGPSADPPLVRSTPLQSGLFGLSPFVILAVLALTSRVAFREGAYWRTLVSLRGNDVAPPAALALLILLMSVGLYLLQGTSPNPSSVRYLVPVWIALPGVLAVGVASLRQRLAIACSLALLVPWSATHVSLLGDMKRPSRLRELTCALEERGVESIVATTPIAVVVAELSRGRVGALEYQPIWARLGARYRGRFAENGPVWCVADTRRRDEFDADRGWAREADLGRRLRAFEVDHAGQVEKVFTIREYELWKVELPLPCILQGTTSATERNGPTSHPKDST